MVDKKELTGYGQYKKDLFVKLGFNFVKGRDILDVGCGDGSDASIFEHVYGLDVSACDVYENDNVASLNLDFKIGSILELPYAANTFDYIFLHDVLHHVDEEKQSREQHVRALRELKRVIKPSGSVVVVEGNRYNPLFYPHMVKIRGHNHFRQSYFKDIILEVFPSVEFKFFEAHVYPAKLLCVFKIYEFIMEYLIPRQLRAYNVAVCRPDKM